MQTDSLLLEVEQQIDIRASRTAVFEAMLAKLSQDNTTPSGEAMPMVLERRPGGRWFRDLGLDAGHLWGLVQVIKPPQLLEIWGPMFMSYPAAGHLSLRLTENEGTTRLMLKHRVLGLIQEDHRAGVVAGWEHLLNSVQASSE